MQSNGTWQLLRVVGRLSFLKSMINILTAIPLSRRGPNHQGRGVRRALNESERKQITSSSIIACGYPGVWQLNKLTGKQINDTLIRGCKGRGKTA